MWKNLGKKQLNGVKFYRQYSVGPYILDFFCPSLKLAIELDGEPHGRGDAKIYDAERSGYLGGFKIQVIRFKNAEIIENLQSVLVRICLLLDKRRLEEL